MNLCCIYSHFSFSHSRKVTVDDITIPQNKQQSCGDTEIIVEVYI
jgi:hypothetical protein